jgi:hypothetical protein
MVFHDGDVVRVSEEDDFIAKKVYSFLCGPSRPAEESINVDSCYEPLLERQETDMLSPVVKEGIEDDAQEERDPSSTEVEALSSDDGAGELLRERHEVNVVAGHNDEIKKQNDPEEDCEFVDQCLCQMEIELGNVDCQTRLSPYKRAKFIDPDRVTSRAFRLLFLRSVSFDPLQAAQKMVQHFECKVDLFGDDKVAKDITLNDLDENDRKALQAGSVQFLPGTDREGRVVQVVVLRQLRCPTWENQVKKKK